MIIIQLDKKEAEIIHEIQSIESGEPQQVEKSNFNGQQELIDMLIKITPLSLPLIANVINNAIKAKKQIVIKHKGITIQGLNQKNSVEILKKLIDKDDVA